MIASMIGSLGSAMPFSRRETVAVLAPARPRNGPLRRVVSLALVAADPCVNLWHRWAQLESRDRLPPTPAGDRRGERGLSARSTRARESRRRALDRAPAR